MNTDTLTANLLTITVEVATILLVFILLNWVLSWVLRSLSATPALERFEPSVAVLRRKLRLILALVSSLVVVAVASSNLYLMYQGENLREYTMALVRSIPMSFWVDLGIAAGKVVALLIVTAAVLRVACRALALAGERAKALEGIKANDESIERLFVALTRIAVRGAWLLTLVLSTRLLDLPARMSDTMVIVLKIYLIFAVGMLCWRTVDALVASVEALSKKYADEKNLLRLYDRLKPLVPVLQRSIEYVIYVIVATLIVLQVELVASLAEWGPRIIRIIGVVFIGRVAVELMNLLVEEMLITRARLTSEQKQRRGTLVPLLRGGLKYLIYFGVAVIVLGEVGINPMPILAGAGIIGLAVGLGAQNLINDILSGFFILFEEHYLIGDFVKASDAEGVVESIDLRTTRIRDSSGRHHIVRNGQIGDLVNYSKTFTHAVVEVGVAYESNLDEVLAVLEAVGERLDESRDDVLAPTMVQGLDAFGESDLVIRTITQVKPGRHLHVERALRKLVKEAFDEHGIEIPYARRVLIVQNPEALGTAAATA